MNVQQITIYKKERQSVCVYVYTYIQLLRTSNIIGKTDKRCIYATQRYIHNNKRWEKGWENNRKSDLVWSVPIIFFIVSFFFHPLKCSFFSYLFLFFLAAYRHIRTNTQREEKKSIFCLCHMYVYDALILDQCLVPLL